MKRATAVLAKSHALDSIARSMLARDQIYFVALLCVCCFYLLLISHRLLMNSAAWKLFVIRNCTGPRKCSPRLQSSPGKEKCIDTLWGYLLEPDGLIRPPSLSLALQNLINPTMKAHFSNLLGTFSTGALLAFCYKILQI